MGFLHEGHLSLIEAARGDCDTVVMSLFVNPLQFDRTDDLDCYPRDLERDAALAADAGVDVVFAPALDEMYPRPQRTTVTVAGLTDEMEGPRRPGHFEGVATVVAKLFAGVRPERAYFGRKDAQQLAIVRRLAADLSFPVNVIGRPIVREADGLALSSRNIFLRPEEHRAALSLSRGLQSAADAVEAGGERAAATLTREVRAAVTGEPGLRLEYVALADQDDVALLDVLDRPAFLALAAWVGETRLIDNIHFDPVDGGYVADRGRPLSGGSVLYRGDD